MKRQFVTMMLILLSGAYAFAQVENSVYPMRSKEYGKGCVYAFVDEISCFICNLDLLTMSKYANAKQVPFVVFILGADSTRAARMIDRSLSSITDYVYDEFYVYNHVFHLESVPRLLMLDKSGNLVYEGIPGKTSFDFDKYLAGLNTILESEFHQFTHPLRGVDSLSVLKHCNTNKHRVNYYSNVG